MSNFPIHFIKENALRKAGLDCSMWINEFCPAHAQVNALAGLYDPAKTQAIISHISNMRLEYLRCKEAINAASTEEEVEAIKFEGKPI
jgi:hypothetical protein